MNFLKKNYKIIIFIFVILLLSVGFCFILFHKTTTKCEIITVENNYYVVNSSMDNKMNIPIYFSLKDSIFVDEDKIQTFYLVNEDESDVIPLTLNNLTYLKEVSYLEDVFYQYDFDFRIDAVIDCLTIYDKIFLKINYQSGQSLKLCLGNLCLYNYQINEDVYYTNLKGVAKDYEKAKVLSFVLLKLNTINDIEIIDITTLNNEVSVDLEKSLVVDYINEDETPINEFIDDNYNIIGQNPVKKSIIVKDNEYLLLYLKYNKYLELPCQGFIITYLDGNKVCEKVISPFVFYKTNNLNQEIYKVVYETDLN